MSESVPADWELTQVNVPSSDPAVVVAGPKVTINLAAGDAIVCTYRDTRIEPPVPAEPIDPPPDPLPPGGGQPDVAPPDVASGRPRRGSAS